MKKSSNLEHKIFVGFGILATLSGIYLMFNSDLFFGISGTITGLFVTYMSTKNLKSNTDK